MATQMGGLAYDQLTMQQQQWNQQELGQIQHNYNLEYQQNQFQNQQNLNQQGHNLQMDMWNKTNYGAQMDHLKKAGLNPALMYQQGGQGGQTGSQTGGSAGGQNAGLGMAPQAPEFKLFGAQEALMKEQARLAKIEGDKKEGIDTKEAQSRIDNNEMDTELKRLKAEWNKKGYIDGQPLATMMNMIGKDPINSEEDRAWLLNRLYGYFGLKAATDIVQTIISARTLRNVTRNMPNPKKGGTGGHTNRDGSKINTNEIKIVNPNKYKGYGNQNNGNNMSKHAQDWEGAFGDSSSGGMGITVPKMHGNRNTIGGY